MIEAIAHRGYGAKYPENTLSAFAAAIHLDFAVVELDVQLSADGIPVVIHDKNVDRVTNGTGLVKECTLKQLKELTVYGKESIPTLAEVFTRFGGKTRFAIELKNEQNMYPGIELAVLTIVQEFGLVKDVYINSFNHQSVERMRQLSSEIELGFIKSWPTTALFSKMHLVNATSLAMNYRYFSQSFARKCTREGIQLIVYGIDKKRQMNRILAYPDVRCTIKDLEAFIRLYHKKRVT